MMRNDMLVQQSFLIVDHTSKKELQLEYIGPMLSEIEQGD